MEEKENDQERILPTEQSEDVNGMSFILFLILILLIMSSGNTFSSYFNLFENEVNRASNIFESLSLTANNLQSVFQTSAELQNKN